jgi:hypothetical protein
MEQSLDVNPAGFLATNTFLKHANPRADAYVPAVRCRVAESNATMC